MAAVSTQSKVVEVTVATAAALEEVEVPEARADRWAVQVARAETLAVAASSLQMERGTMEAVVQAGHAEVVTTVEILAAAEGSHQVEQGTMGAVDSVLEPVAAAAAANNPHSPALTGEARELERRMSQPKREHEVAAMRTRWMGRHGCALAGAGNRDLPGGRGGGGE